MTLFKSSREAKEFLVSRIVEEAKRENLPFSEVERKMLYFSETDWTLPDMSAVSDEFDREYDQDEYEKKMALLIRKAASHDRRQSRQEYDLWWNAIRLLEKEDHYILVMIRGAGLRPQGDQLKLFGAGVLIATFLIVFEFSKAFISKKYGIDFGKYIPSGEAFTFYVWATAVCAALGYLILRFAIGAKKADDLISKPWRK